MIAALQEALRARCDSQHRTRALHQNIYERAEAELRAKIYEEAIAATSYSASVLGSMYPHVMAPIDGNVASRFDFLRNLYTREARDYTRYAAEAITIFASVQFLIRANVSRMIVFEIEKILATAPEVMS
jgi:hypothetical protein